MPFDFRRTVVPNLFVLKGTLSLEEKYRAAKDLHQLILSRRESSDHQTSLDNLVQASDRAIAGYEQQIRGKIARLEQDVDKLRSLLDTK